ncbi:hypothetical protein P9314_17105 [Paenibacillus validus]|uniref:N-acetyltransferase n=1 Tax=Paenibacillus validus TaxID=44253 RepID=UPI000FD97639|nr:N-acetyltransferase [Paenibacillus validus]MED4602388.1 hypothetical protein [Paenibacillus validus]MED4608913.1 hypothetical protein [Paenibacillus validus]
MKKSIGDYIDNFSLVNLTQGYRIEEFQCSIAEYESFLKEQALEFQELNISRTFLLINKMNADIVAYMALVSDSIRLSIDERTTHFPEKIMFPNFPAIKIGKLAVSSIYQQEYKGIGSLMIELARGIAQEVNDSVACKFITVDADIENDEHVTDFYYKNNFVLNEEINKGKRRTISMRLNIFDDPQAAVQEDTA